MIISKPQDLDKESKNNHPGIRLFLGVSMCYYDTLFEAFLFLAICESISDFDISIKIRTDFLFESNNGFIGFYQYIALI